MRIQIMNEDDCMTFIRSERTGRLACCDNQRPYVVPVHYACSERSIYVFSMPGRKLDFMRANPNVCFEVDKIEHSSLWKSVVVEGVFREFDTPEEKQAAWAILNEYNDWWEVGGQPVGEDEVHGGKREPVFYSISIDTISGRHAADF